MKSTITLAANMNTNPFEIFAQDADEVILMINFYLILGAESKADAAPATSAKPLTAQKNARIRVNDKTASGGWY